MIAASIFTFLIPVMHLQAPISNPIYSQEPQFPFHARANQNAQLKPYKLSVVAEQKAAWNYVAQRPSMHEYWDLSKDIPSVLHTLSERK